MVSGVVNIYSRLLRELDTRVIRACLDIASAALQLEAGRDLASLWCSRGEAANQLRLAHYVPGQRPGAGLLYGEHTDYDGLTLLWRNSNNGLQVTGDLQTPADRVTVTRPGWRMPGTRSRSWPPTPPPS